MTNSMNRPLARSPTMNDIAGPILVQAVRFARPRHLNHAHAVAQILNVLPRSSVPAVSDAAIMVMPWIDSELACKLGDLWLLDTLHYRLARPPTHRPLNCTPRDALRNAAKNGHLHVLDWWKANMGDLDHDSDRAVAFAGCQGHPDVMQWWLANGTNPLYDGCAEIVEYAAWHGHPGVVELLRASGFPFSPKDCAEYVAEAVYGEKNGVVRWFAQRHLLSELTKKEVGRALVLALIQRDRFTVDALLALDQVRQFTEMELDRISAFACASSDLAFVEHCHLQFPQGINHPLAYLIASCFGHVHLLDWLLGHGVPQGHCVLQYDDLRHLDYQQLELGGVGLHEDHDSRAFSPFFTAIACSHVHVLDWLHKNSVNPNLEADAVGLQFATVPTLTWAQRHHAELFSLIDIGKSLQHASTKGCIDVLDWWVQTVDRNHLATASAHVDLQHACLAVWKWWSDSGLAFAPYGKDQCARLPLPPLEVCSWLLDNGRFPTWMLSKWISDNVLDADDDSFLCWAHENGLIQPLLQTLSPAWPLDAADFPFLSWPTLLWWIENGGTEFHTRLQKVPWPFPNTLMLDYCWESCGKAGAISVDGGLLSKWDAVHALDWALRAGVRIYHNKPLNAATSHGHVQILEWWLKHAEQLKPVVPKARKVAKLCRGVASAWEWWLQSGLVTGLHDYEDVALGLQ